MIIACVLKSGGVYKPEHVAALQRMVERHMPVSHRFVCLTDFTVAQWGHNPGPAVTWRVHLKQGWPGWWSKLELFRTDWRAGEDVLYFDLDTIIVGNIAPLLETSLPFTAIDDWWQEGINSSVMLIRSDVPDTIWRHACRAGIDRIRRDYRRGDQQFIGATMQTELFQPGLVLSYKADNLATSPLPDGAVAVQFHGRPKYWEVSHGWITDALRTSPRPAVAG